MSSTNAVICIFYIMVVFEYVLTAMGIRVHIFVSYRIEDRIQYFHRF